MSGFGEWVVTGDCLPVPSLSVCERHPHVLWSPRIGHASFISLLAKQQLWTKPIYEQPSCLRQWEGTWSGSGGMSLITDSLRDTWAARRRCGRTQRVIGLAQEPELLPVMTQQIETLAAHRSGNSIPCTYCLSRLLLKAWIRRIISNWNSLQPDETPLFPPSCVEEEWPTSAWWGCWPPHYSSSLGFLCWAHLLPWDREHKGFYNLCVRQKYSIWHKTHWLAEIGWWVASSATWSSVCHIDSSKTHLSTVELCKSSTVAAVSGVEFVWL